MTSRLHVPVRSPRDVIPFLARGESHWREGYSAHALATTWMAQPGLPRSVRQLLDTSERFAGAELVDGFFERQTELGDGRRRASQTDLLALLRVRDTLAVMAVEAKVEEPFGDPIGDQAHLTEGQRGRLAWLAAFLGMSGQPLGHLRYQLFHRAAAAVIEAERHASATALLLVQSFSQRRTGFADFAAFAAALGFGTPQPMQITASKRIRDVDFSMAWLADDLPRAARSTPLDQDSGQVDRHG